MKSAVDELTFFRHDSNLQTYSQHFCMSDTEIS